MRIGKKNISAMKKSYYLLLVAVLVLAGCAKEQVSPSVTGKGRQITVTANAENPVSTKATASDAGVVEWSTGDQIGVFDLGDGQTYPLTFVDGTDKSFSGTVSSSPNLRFAIAPYNSSETLTGDASNVMYSIVLPSTYNNYVPGTTNAPMVAAAPTADGDNYVFDFKHVAALVKVTYENVPVGTAGFCLDTDQKIAGTIDTFESTSDVEFTTPSNSAASAEVDLDLSSAVTTPNQTMSFYVPVPVATYTYFRVKLVDADLNTISGTGRKINLTGDDQTFKRAELHILPTITLDAATAGDSYNWTLAKADIGESGTAVSKGEPTALSWTPTYSVGSVGNLDSTKGLQIGTSDTPCTSLTLTTSGYTDYISNVLVNFSTANDGDANVSVKVGDTSLTYGSDNATKVSGTTTPATYEFKADGLVKGDVTITFTNTKKAFYIRKISINGDPRAEQTLSFSSSTASAVVGEDFTEPTLSGAQTTVTYSSSDTGVATVDASTGEVTLVAAGTTTITATAAADETYQEASASYTLTVNAAYQFSTIAGMKELFTGTSSSAAVTAIGKLTDAVVTYVSGSNAYIEDASAGVLIYLSGHGLEAGQSISGEVTVSGFKYNGLPEINSLTTTNATITSGATIPCSTVTLATLNTDDGYATWESRRVKIEDATVTTAFNSTGSAAVSGEISQDGSTIVPRVNKNITITKATENNIIDVVGYPSVFSSTKQLTVWSDDDITVTGGAGAFTITDQPSSVKVGSTVTFSVSVNSGAEITVTSSDEGIATVSYDSSTGTATVKGVSEGTATISLSAPANGNFTAASASFDVTVGSSEDVTIDLTAQGYENQQEVATVSSSDRKVTLTFDKGTGSNTPKYYTSGTAVRVYGGGTIKVSSTGTITKAIFTWDSSNKPTSADVASTGTYDTSSSTWTGSASEFTLTRPTGSGNWQLQKIVVTVSGATAATKHSITIGAVTNGTISANVTEAYEDETVTLTATPDDGYTLDAWSVTDAESNVITVTNNTFTMPGSDVTVSATFKEKSSAGTDPDADGTCFNLTSYSSLPDGWTCTSVSTSSYYKIDAGGSMTSPAYNLSGTGYNTATISINVAKYGNGTNPAATLSVSYDGGDTYTETTTLTAPTSNKYSTQTYTLTGTLTSNVVIKLENPTGNASLRVQSFSLKLSTVSE